MRRKIRDALLAAALVGSLVWIEGAVAEPMTDGTDRAAADGASTSGEIAEMLLAPRVNGVVFEEPALLIEREGRLYARAGEFRRWRIAPPEVDGIDFNSETWLPLKAVQDLDWRIDQSAQELVIDADPARFDASVVGARTVGYGDFTAPPPPPPGGFLNYDLQYQNTEVADILNGLVEVGVFSPWGVVTSSFLGEHSDFDDRLVRLDTTLTHDMPLRLSSLRAGDSIGRPSAWGRAVRFGGLQWSTNFNTQPNFTSFPLPTLSGESALPSTVEIYADNARRLSREVPPGPFSVPNVPLVTGAGEVQLVVRDVLGREQVLTRPYYVSRNLLRPGFSEFSYEIGAERDNFGFKSNDYGDVFAAGTHRYGFTETFTGEARAEVLEDQQTAGFSGSWLWSRLGSFNATLAGSRQGGDEGTLYGFGFDRQSRGLSFGVQTEFITKDFDRLGQLDDRPPPRRTTLARLGMPLNGFGSISMNYTRRDERGLPDSEFLTAGYSMNLWGGFFLSVFGLKDLTGKQDDSLSVTLTRPLGNRTTASANYSARNGNRRTGQSLQRNLPAGRGYGYRLLTEQGDSARDQVSVQARNDVATFNADASRFNGANAYRFGVAGGIAILDGHGFLSRRVDESFGVVKVADYEDVRVYADNQPVGTTNEDGYALIPRLRAYEENRIRIAESDLPLEAQIDALELIASPWFRSGALVDFPVRSIRDALLVVDLEDGEPLPSGAVVEVSTSGEEFPVALRGEAYLTGLTDRNTVRVTWRGQTCELEFELPADAGPQPIVGPLVCEDVQREPV